MVLNLAPIRNFAIFIMPYILLIVSNQVNNIFKESRANAKPTIFNLTKKVKYRDTNARKGKHTA